MKHVILAISLFFLAAAPCLAADPIDAILDQARADCTSLDNGEFDADDAVVEVDLDGQGAPDRIVDTSRFKCSSARSLYCGSGGCDIHAVIGEESWRYQAEGWRMIDWDGRPILLIMRDGGWCGGAGAQVCYEAVVWSHGEMLTVMPQR
jgi:hypothetical protein